MVIPKLYFKNLCNNLILDYKITEIFLNFSVYICIHTYNYYDIKIDF